MNFLLRESSVVALRSPSRRQGLVRTTALALAALLVGCGQKGPLTLPGPAGAASAPAAAK